MAQCLNKTRYDFLVLPGGSQEFFNEEASQYGKNLAKQHCTDGGGGGVLVLAEESVGSRAMEQSASKFVTNEFAIGAAIAGTLMIAASIGVFIASRNFSVTQKTAQFVYAGAATAFAGLTITWVSEAREKSEDDSRFRGREML